MVDATAMVAEGDYVEVQENSQGLIGVAVPDSNFPGENSSDTPFSQFSGQSDRESVGSPVPTMSGGRNPYELSDDGELMMTRPLSGVIDLWHVWDHTLLRRVNGNDDWDIMKDEDLVITYGGDDVIRFFSASTGRPIAELHGHTGAVTNIWVSPDGRSLLSAAKDDTVRVWAMPR